VFTFTTRFAIGVGFFLAFALVAQAQDKPRLPKQAEQPAKAEPLGSDYRDLFTKPENAAGYWDAMRFEIEVGKFDLAAELLKGLLAKGGENGEELLPIEEKEGMAAFLRLQNIPKWSNDRSKDAEAKRNVDTLIARVSEALKQKLGDGGRIDKFIKRLSATPDERDFALKELYRSGPVAIPRMIAALRQATGEERQAIVSALPRMRSDTIPPLLAALDIDDAELRLELIGVFNQRAARAAIPNLWFLAGSPRQPELVRRKATETLARFFNMPADRLPLSRVALTAEAERYYQHQVRFPDPQAVTVWRWDGKDIVAGWPPKVRAVSASKAEEYYGLRFAKMALEVDPGYEPAQIVFLSLAIEKGLEGASLSQPLAKAAPRVNELVTTSNPELVIAVLERAINDHRLLVVLGATQALGELAEVRAVRPLARGEPALVRALDYPDRRVQLAAAQALLKNPGTPTPSTNARVVEVLRRAVAAAPDAQAAPADTQGSGKVLVAFVHEDVATAVGNAVAKAGYEAVVLRSGRELLQRLGKAADIDALVIDSELPDPSLASLLAQLRSDLYAGQLPIVVAAPDDREVALRGFVEPYANVRVVPAAATLDPALLKKLLSSGIAAAMVQPLGQQERKVDADTALRWLARIARGEVAEYNAQPAADTVVDALRNAKLSDEAAIAAVDVVGRLPGRIADRNPQNELATVVLDPGRSTPVRSAAAAGLVRHIQARGPLLAVRQVKDLQQLLAAATDVTLKASVASVLGSMQRDAYGTGERLRSYAPPPPLPPQPAVPAEPAPPKNDKQPPPEKP